MRDLEDRSDEELMALYQNGDARAFECLYLRHSGRVYQYLKAKVSSDTAQDLLQETFLKVHRSRAQYLPQYPFLPWLFTIARNNLNDFFKSADQKAVKIEFDPDSSQKETLAATNEHDLAAALTELPPLQKRAIELRYLNEWSFEQIAEDMKTTPENSRQIISRGIKKIRSFLKGGAT